ncbi:MAG: S8 family serine peptidase [Bacteroidia bacterium]|nr:S8 family serine peptidase [Bacteroidia bacterium]
MRLLIKILLAVFIFSGSLSAQTEYYWTPEGKVYLMENRQRLLLEFNERVATPFERNLSRSVADEVSALKATGNKFFVEFNKEQSTKQENLFRKFGIDASKLKSVSWGKVSDEGVDLFLVEKVMYLENDNFDSGIFNLILDTHYPDAQLKTTGGGLKYVEVADAQEALWLANEMYESEMFHYAHPDMYLGVQLTSPSAKNEVMACPSAPTDPYYGVQYYLHNEGGIDFFNYPYQAAEADIDIDAPEAWCISKGDTGIVVAVVDQGVEAHEDLNNDSITGTPSRVMPGYSTITSTPTQSLFGEPSADSIDHGHGQGVAGIIAASHNNVGVAGVAPKVKILPVHVNIFFSTAAEFADGISWAWRNGADVINNSWTFSFCTTNDNFYPAIKNAIDSAMIRGRDGKGCVVVFASGDTRDGTPGTTCIHYPGSVDEVMTVGAISARGLLPDYARYGAELDLVSVSSPDKTLNNISVIDRMGNLGYNTDTTSTLNYLNRNYTMWFGGTSSSSATVSGVAALVLSINPDLNANDVNSILVQNTSLVNGVTFSNEFGFGIVNANQAAQAAENSLPVEWLYVDGKQRANNIEITWGTATEVNNDKFVVEKKSGDLFVPLAQVKGAGNTTQVQNYSFVDRDPKPGSQVYRIKQVDFDGRFSHSPLVEVLFSDENYFNVDNYLSSSEARLKVNLFNLKNQVAELNLLDLQGRELANWVLKPVSEDQPFELEIPSVSAGVYILQMRQQGFPIDNQKIIFH